MRAPIMIAILFPASIISCGEQSSNNPAAPTIDNKPAAETAFVPTDSSQLYFPLKTFLDTSADNGRDTFLNISYSYHLFAMKEPVIFMDKSQKEIYRFTWLRSFDNPIAIRIEKHTDTCLLYWKLCNGAAGYEAGQLIINKQKALDKPTWDEFIKKLSLADFWNLKTNRETGGLDGAEWILEGKSKNQYHVVNRWSPNRAGEYFQCCDFLIGLTDLKIKAASKY